MYEKHIYVKKNDINNNLLYTNYLNIILDHITHIVYVIMHHSLYFLSIINNVYCSCSSSAEKALSNENLIK